MTELRLRIMTNHITKLLGPISSEEVEYLLKIDEVVDNFAKYYPFNIGMLEQGYSSCCADTGCLDPQDMIEAYSSLYLVPNHKAFMREMNNDRNNNIHN